MKLLILLTTLYAIAFLVEKASANDESVRRLGFFGWKRNKKGKSMKNCVACERPDPFSIVNTNDSWDPNVHTYHAQVWYLPLSEIQDLWEQGYFDYVLDVRGLNDMPRDGNMLPGWESEHIPGSFPTDFNCLDGSCDALTFTLRDLELAWTPRSLCIVGEAAKLMPPSRN